MPTASTPRAATPAARRLVRLGALLGLLGVAAGTFGAHGLEQVAEGPKALEWWDTAVQYHLVHALALLITGVLAGQRPCRSNRLAGAAFGFGVAVFSGTLYAMALGAPRWLGAITPLGGVGLLVGWAALLRAGGAAEGDSAAGG